jgi:hypothetical protein
MNIQRLCKQLFMILAIAFSGCGPAMYPVTGTVVYEDGTPMQGGGWIVFMPNAADAVSAAGYINTDGTLVGYTYIPDPPDGVLPGTYRVGVVGNQEAPATPSPHVAERFADPSNSGLQVEVKPEKNVLTIRVTKK